MTLPDFEEFRQYVANERMADLDTGGIHIKYQITDPTNPENVSAFVSDVVKQAITESAQITVQLLALYHEWIQEQFDKSE